MKFTRIASLLLLIIASCGQSDRKGKPTDTTVTNQPDTSEEFGSDLATIRNDYIASYDQVIMNDTLFQAANRKYGVKFKHYCTRDSALLVPAKYNFDTKRDFTTHNFQSTLIVISGTDTMFEETIGKQFFEKILNPEEIKYATLLYPHLSLEDDSIKIQYSISIPVTDVGIAANIKFDTLGHYRVFR